MKLLRECTRLIIITIFGFVLTTEGVLADQILDAGPAFGIDDFNTVTAVAPVFTAGGFVDTALKNSKFKTPAWIWTPASLEESAAVRADITIDPYVAWAVTEPLLILPNGHPVGGEGGFDWGGINVVFKFIPNAEDPLRTASEAAAAQNNNGPIQLHWLQVFHQSDNLGLNRTLVDKGRSPKPWYDALGEAGMVTLNNAGSWLGDAPLISENFRDRPDPRPGSPGVERIDPYKYNDRFETYLALDSIAAGVNYVTLYGGWAWGYDYHALDQETCGVPVPLNQTADGTGLGGCPTIPEPSTLAILMLPIGGTLVILWARNGKRRRFGYRTCGLNSPGTRLRFGI